METAEEGRRPRSRPRFRPEEKDTSPADAASPEAGGYAVKGRIWIARGEETFLGYGRAVLLERIRECGSISEAARSMDMSYRHAWELVDSMNRQAPSPLVDTSTGGAGGGGARLTPLGEAAIELFWELYRDFKGHLRKQHDKLQKLRSPAPPTCARPEHRAVGEQAGGETGRQERRSAGRLGGSSPERKTEPHAR